MKILYIGNYRDGTGWGEACLNNILALNYHADVVCRPISFNKGAEQVPPIIEELEDKSTKGVDIVIQHTLPNYYVYNGNVKNVCIYEPDTVFSDTNWQKHINMMDLAIVPTQSGKALSEESGVKIPISVVPHSIPFSRTKDYGTMKAKELEGSFNFVFLGEMVRRKNLPALLRAFHTEFHPREPVNLFVKTSQQGKNGDQALAEFNRMADEIKRGLKIRKNYKKEVVITGRLDKTHLLSLLAQCHCFVSPSYGEAWNYGALESMALGLPVIHTGDMMDYSFGWHVDYFDSPCFQANDSIENIYTSDTNWKIPDINHLRRCMREAYNEHKTPAWATFKATAKAIAAEHDNEVVGKDFVETLCSLI